MSRFPGLVLAASLIAPGFIAPTAAQAADETQVKPAFGNTVLSIYPDGRSQKIWLHPDGTWSGKSRRGLDLDGHWSMKGDRICLRQSHPPTLPISFCQTFPKDPSVELTSKDLTGQTIHLKIVKGVTATGT